MRYRLLGRSGLRVSEVCLGAMTFGDTNFFAGQLAGADDAESRAMFDAFADAGGNFIDTAGCYSHGHSEALLGDFIAADRDRFVIATKYTIDHGAGLTKTGNSRRNMMRSAEQSLRRLKTDHIDLFQAHTWDLTTPIDELMRGFDDLVSSGKVLYVGVSNTPAWVIARANAIADLLGHTPLISIQIPVSLLHRDSENDILPMSRALDLGILAWGPLASGVLARAPDAARTRRAGGRVLSEREHRMASVVAEIARELGASPAQTALAALRQLPGYGGVIPIIGASRAQHVTDSLGFLEVTLTAGQMARVQAVSKPTLIHPASLVYGPYGEALATDGQTGLLDNHRL